MIKSLVMVLSRTKEEIQDMYEVEQTLRDTILSIEVSSQLISSLLRDHNYCELTRWRN